MERSERTEPPAEPVRGSSLKRVIDQGVEALLDELQQGQSDRLQHYLAFSAHFHHYSLMNQFLM